MRTLLAFLLLCSPALAVDIVYVRAPRFGDGSQAGDRITRIPEVWSPIKCEPGTDLVLLRTNGTEEVLVESGPLGCVLDPCPSLDAQWVYYSLIPDATKSQAHPALLTGADIYKLNVATREVVRLTNQEWTPNRAITTQAAPPQPIYNLGACPLPNGRVMFTSSRNNYTPVKGQTWPNMQLFVMDADGKHVEEIGFLNLGSALHPTLLTDGRVMFSSYESQGHRASTLWSLWAIRPSGHTWEPLVSSLDGGGSGHAWHWQSQWPDGDVGVVEYYNGGNFGAGTIFGFPLNVPEGTLTFGSPDENLNPLMLQPFERWGMFRSTPWTNSEDRPIAGNVGKVSMPSGAPGGMLLAYTAGPVNRESKPYPDFGIYFTGKTTAAAGDLAIIKNDPAFNEIQPKALVSWASIYGSDPPALVDDAHTHPLLPPGSPFGLVGTSSFYNRDTAASKPVWNWLFQGANSTPGGVEFDSALIAKVRILAQEPNSYNGSAIDRNLWEFDAVGFERLRVLGEVDLRKPGVLDPQGNPDTSFLANFRHWVERGCQDLSGDPTTGVGAGDQINAQEVTVI